MSADPASATVLPPLSRCRFCSEPLGRVVADLGMSPLANAYVANEDLASSETFYPLRALVCDACLLVQLEEFEPPNVIFSDYLYFSSYSSSWLDHSRRFADQMATELALEASSRVVEIASNDGYLLQYFLAKGISVLGIEPSATSRRRPFSGGCPPSWTFSIRGWRKSCAAVGVRICWWPTT